jgi:mycoredoxin
MLADERRAIVVYGATWRRDCERARRLLDAHRVRYHWIDVEHDAAAMAHVQKLNRGLRSVPTIVFSDGSILAEPSNHELLQRIMEQ